MSQAPIMPFYTDAYLADTHHLSTVAHGAYILLLLHTWRCNGTAPKDDDRLLARITKLPLQQWKRVRFELEPFFRINDGQWRQKRLEATWAQVQQKIELQRAKGAKGNAARRRKKELSFKHCTVAAAVAQDPFAPSPSKTHKPLSNKPSLEKELRSNGKEVLQEAAPSLKPASSRSTVVRSGKQHDSAQRIANETPALKRFSPILCDVTYFVGEGKSLPEDLRVHLPAAQHELGALLTPIDDEALQQIVDKLWRLFPRSSHDPSLRQDYIVWLEHYPADLIEQAYDELVRSHPYPTVPRLSDFATIMDPHVRQRQLQKERLEKLAERNPS